MVCAIAVDDRARQSAIAVAVFLSISLLPKELNINKRAPGLRISGAALQFSIHANPLILPSASTQPDPAGEQHQHADEER